MEKINFSIIIPHKNTPDLLHRCLDSIPLRDDIQIIIVDDNSDENIVNFKKFPGNGNNNVEIIYTKDGKGAGYARNIGVSKAIGTWVIFADADDFFNYCINEILTNYISSDSDIIFFKHNCIDSEYYTNQYRAIEYNTYIDNWLNHPEKYEYFLRYRNNVIWSKMFKRELIQKNNILFDEIHYSNDMTFAYLTGFYANSISADCRSLYCTTIRKGSIRFGKRTIDNQLDMLYADGKRYRFLYKNKIPLSGRNSFTNTITKLFFKNKKYYTKAKLILTDLGFSSHEILWLCFLHIILYIPKKIILQIFKISIYCKIISEFRSRQI